jgi:hypothetical protein
MTVALRNLVYCNLPYTPMIVCKNGEVCTPEMATILHLKENVGEEF